MQCISVRAVVCISTQWLGHGVNVLVFEFRQRQHILSSPRLTTGGRGGWSPHSGIFPGGKSAEAWSWPLTCTYYQGYEWVELYLYSVCMRPWRGKVQLYLTVFTCLTVEDVNEYSWNISKANAGVPLSMMLHIDDCAWRLAAAVQF